VATQLCRGVFGALFAVTVSTSTVTIWLLYATAVVIGVGETLADSAAHAAVPRLARADQLEADNGRLISADTVTEIVSTPIGGAPFAPAAAAPFFIDAATSPRWLPWANPDPLVSGSRGRGGCCSRGG
jgi:hypothetical protein